MGLLVSLNEITKYIWKWENLESYLKNKMGGIWLESLYK